ncbi:MAG TPA: hypothetical protein VMV05_04665 [bacterium]|nr:hypothetical protein [bacterium]
MPPVKNTLGGPRAAAIILFFFSGATSLVYEVLWTRQFELILGATTTSAGAVLAAFMGGLFLGSRLGARASAFLRRPLAAYGWLELGIGLYALILASSFHGVDLAFQFLETRWPFPPSLFILPRFAGSMLILMVPTTLMGATLPFLSNLAAGLEKGESSFIGRLYAVNTTGAVAGALAAGYWLLPALGQWKTAALAASLNGLLGLASWGLGARLSPSAPGRPLRASGAPSPSPAVSAALAVAALSGCAAMMDEVGYNRVLCMVLGGSVYAFSAMLSSFLSGIAAGAFVFSRSRDSGPAAAKKLAVVQFALGLVVLLTMYSFDRLWMAFMVLADALINHGLDLNQWQKAIQLFLAFAVLFPTAFLCGSVFPLALKAYPRLSRAPGWEVGGIYGYNTLGAITGSLLAALLLVPGVGVQRTLEAGICLNLLAGALLLSSRRPRWRLASPASLGWGLTALAAMPLLWSLLPTWNRHNLAVGPFFQLISASDLIPDFSQRLAETDLLYYREGLVNTVTVEKAPAFNTLVLSNNGKVEASSVGDLPTEQLVAHIPMLWRQCSGSGAPLGRVAVIGLASGITAGSVLPHHPGRLDVVDLEPFMPQAAALFKDFNFGILSDPRFHFIADDARHYLRLQPGAYDVLISEPSNPWLSGVSNLFSREFFGIGKRALAPGGVYAQWVQIYGMKPEDVKAICRTFTSVFPQAYLFGIPPAPGDLKPVPDILLLGSETPLRPRIPAMERAIQEPALRAALGRVNVSEAGDLVSMLRMGPGELSAFCAGAGLDTDDNGLIEFSAPLHLYDGECYTANMLEIRKFQPDPTLYVEPEKPAALKKILRRAADDLEDYWGRDLAATLRHRAAKL